MSVKEGQLKKLEVMFAKRLEEQTRTLKKEVKAETTFLEDKLRAEITLVEDALRSDSTIVAKADNRVIGILTGLDNSKQDYVRPI